MHRYIFGDNDRTTLETQFSRDLETARFELGAAMGFLFSVHLFLVHKLIFQIFSY